MGSDKVAAGPGAEWLNTLESSGEGGRDSSARKLIWLGSASIEEKTWSSERAGENQVCEQPQAVTQWWGKQQHSKGTPPAAGHN